jgi:hypothetical protein
MAAATSRRKSAGMLLNIVTALELQEMAVLIRPSRQRRPYASENALSRICGRSRLSRTGFHGDRVSWLPLFISREILVSFYGA